MTTFEIAALLLVVAALCGFLNEKFVKLPTTIGLMAISSAMSIGFLVAKAVGLEVGTAAEMMIAQIDFEKALMEGMLCFLLFAGALHINLGDLVKQVRIISILATFGVILSTFLVGLMMKGLLGVLGVEMSWTYCFLFGALISPTDPIAVLALLKKVGAPKSLETKIAGESLFNDGVGVVVFLLLLETLTGHVEMNAARIATFFVQEAVGGIGIGLLFGYVGYKMLKQLDNYSIEILVTLALVMGCYALAQRLHFSGPLAMVVIGLMIGNIGRYLAMSTKTREHLDTFWELIDEILNAVLFVLLGLELVILDLSLQAFVIGLAAIPIVLLSRWLCVLGPISMLRAFKLPFNPHAVKVMTWGGLRGGISVALALTLPAGDERQFWLVATYCVVLFTIIVQGLTMSKLLRLASSAHLESDAKASVE
ncbi:MAG: sodium:proton antiporter [Verrucomicrobia bacterium]|nr:sodium:proton antiporter [Verrucomicrobiota bacterium]